MVGVMNVSPFIVTSRNVNYCSALSFIINMKNQFRNENQLNVNGKHTVLSYKLHY